MNTMPIAFHFQLDPQKPDEQRALQLIEELEFGGWTMQKIIVTALLALDDSEVPAQTQEHDALLTNLQHMLLESQEQSNTTLGHANRVLEQVQQVVGELKNFLQTAQSPATPNPPSQPPPERDPKTTQEAVKPDFIAALIKGMKPGIHSDDDTKG